MSKEAAIQFVKKVIADRSVQEELVKLGPDDMDGLLKIAHDLGVANFTIQEYYDACAVEPTTGTSEQLTDAELDKIAGAGGSVWTPMRNLSVRCAYPKYGRK